MELTIKYLAAYLPYGLKVDIGAIYSLKGIRDGYAGILRFEDGSPTERNIIDIKPILRPLSDLTKEITINGEVFVPMESIYKMRSLDWNESFLKEKALAAFKRDLFTLRLQYDFVEKLLSWHFDCFGLIENNLAININEINNL